MGREEREECHQEKEVASRVGESSSQGKWRRKKDPGVNDRGKLCRRRRGAVARTLTSYSREHQAFPRVPCQPRSPERDEQVETAGGPGNSNAHDESHRASSG